MPSNAVLSFTDPDEHHAAIRAGEARALVTTPGNYRGELTRIDLHKLWMQRGQASLPLIVHTAVSNSRAAFFSWPTKPRRRSDIPGWISHPET